MDRVPTPLRMFSVEEIRVQAEHELLTRLRLPADDGGACLSYAAQRDWVAQSAVRLTPQMVPELFSVARLAQRVLGITRPLELYQVAAMGQNACTYAAGATDRL